MRDTGKTLIAPGATGTISGGANKDLSVNRILENAGTLTVSGGTVFFNISSFGGGAVINNLAGGVFEVQGDTDFSNNFPSVSSLNNAGLFRKTGGGTTTLSSNQIALNNSGTIEITSGSLRPEAGFTQNGIVRGSGILVANVTNNGTFQPDPVPGGLIVQGTYTQTAAGRLELRLAATDPLLQHRGLRVSGAASLNGALAIALEHPFAEPSGAAFPIMSFSSRAGDFTSVTGLAENFGYGFTRSFGGTSLDLTVTTQGEVPEPAGLRLPDSTDFAHWMARQTGDAGAGQLRAPGHDADHDGAPNLLEYAFGTSPFDAASALSPVPGTVEDSGQTWATIEFRRRTDTTGLSYQVLESDDLVRWSLAADVMELSRTPVAGQPGLETVRLAIWPALVKNEPCFLSLRVHETAP